MRAQVLAASLAAALACGLAMQTAAAQTPPADNGTVLNLSVTASVKVTPDQLVAELAGVATMATPAEAQRKVNEMMAQAKSIAAGVPGVEVAFRSYTVGYADEKKTRWTAQQMLELKSGGDGAALLDLVGRLQTTGLALDALDWQVSESRIVQARREATIEALKSLQTGASEDAKALGLEVDRLKMVTLDGALPFPRHAARAVAMMAAPPPSSTPEAQDVVATARAEVLLRAPGGGASRP
ncbi:MAG TPA: SIMPL domain-containing protein [Acidisphaera sp.]|nr:SIMPL domain-containing protein [Acidisphaera sp.]